jgi:hypothetical protein
MAVNTTRGFRNLLSKVNHRVSTADPAAGMIQTDYTGGFDIGSSDFDKPLVRHTNSFIMGIHRWGDPDFVVTS